MLYLSPPHLLTLLISSFLLASCGGSDSNSYSDTTNNDSVPTVQLISPTDGATEVSPSIPVTVTFSEYMDINSVESSFSFSDGVNPVLGTFNWGGSSVTFTPNNPLNYSTTYSVSLSSSATNIGGTGLNQAINTSFTTGAAPVSPLAITNESVNLADYPSLPLPGWTFSRAELPSSIRISSNADSATYSRNDIPIGNGEAFQLEAVMSAQSLNAEGERGARLWVQFIDPTVVIFPPGDAYRKVEVRLSEDAAGNRRIALADGLSGAEKGSIPYDWATTAPRYRVRLKRQQIGGTDYIMLQAEPSDVWDAPDNRNPDPDVINSIKVLLSSFSTAPGTAPSEFGFGNWVVGTYFSEWENIHVTRSEDKTTQLPYWPPEPAKPVLSFDDQGIGSLQAVNLSAYNSDRGYLATDTITSMLFANGTILSGIDITGPGDDLWGFLDLNSDQIASGSVTISDVYGRGRTSVLDSLTIPPR